MSSKPYLRIILFFVLGFIIYFADITMNYDEESKDIYISDQELDGLFSAWNSQVGRPPNEQEAINIINDFIQDYNSYKGNAYGLANTLSQTANLKPKIVNKHIDNLFYTGQLTVPGPGVPPSIISGNVVANFVMNQTSK